MKRIAFFIFLCTGIALADNFDKKESIQTCMTMLDHFGVADTFFTSRTCKGIVAEMEDELHYGDSLYGIEKYNDCICLLAEFRYLDLDHCQKLCRDHAIEMMSKRDSINMEMRTREMERCMAKMPAFGKADSAEFKTICKKAANRAVRIQKARPHRE